jgi:iron complex outermembrane receptor protein
MRNSFNKNAFLSVSLATTALATMLPAIAHAQSTPVAAEEPGTMPTDIVITARRSSERLQDVPLSVTAIGGDTLVNKQIVDLKDVAAYTPGLQFRDFVTVFNGNVTIRGLAQANVQNAVANVGVFVDGIYLQRGYMANFTLADVERIEVVKGPQSALYGQNTFSGAINVVTKKPTNVWHADGSVTVGDAGRYEYRAGIGGPIIKDLLSVRGFYGRSRYDGTIRNNFPGVTGPFSYFGGFDRESYSGAVRLTPTSRLTLDASYSHLSRSEEQKAYYSVDGTFVEDRLNCGPINATSGRPSLLCGTLPTNPAVLRSGVGNPPLAPSSVQQPPTTSNTTIYRAAAQWNFIDPLTLYYTFGKTESEAQENLSFPSNGFNPTGRATISQQKEGGTVDFESHEARLAFDNSGPLTAEIGYYHSKSTDNFLFGLFFVRPNTPLRELSSDALSTVGLTVPFTIQEQRFQTDAGFGRVSFDFFDGKANLSAEARYQVNRVELNDILARRTNPARPLLTDSFRDFTPRITASYKITPDNMLFASAARGVKAGGFNGYVTGTTVLLPSEQSFGQEGNWTYELGSKNSLFDNRIVFNITLFYVDWTNQQIRVIPANFPIGNVTQGLVPPAIYAAAGNARNYGVEIQGQFRPLKEFTLNYSFAYSNPTYRSGAVDPVYINICDNVVCARDGSIGGNNIPGTPRLSGSAGLDWNHDAGRGWSLFAGADVNYRGEQHVESVNISRIAAVTLVNGQFGVSHGPVRAFFFVKNLTDKYYLDSAFSIPSLRQVAPSFAERRTLGATVAFNY